MCECMREKERTFVRQITLQVDMVDVRQEMCIISSHFATCARPSWNKVTWPCWGNNLEMNWLYCTSNCCSMRTPQQMILVKYALMFKIQRSERLPVWITDRLNYIFYLATLLSPFSTYCTGYNYYGQTSTPLLFVHCCHQEHNTWLNNYGYWGRKCVNKCPVV